MWRKTPLNLGHGDMSWRLLRLVLSSMMLAPSGVILWVAPLDGHEVPLLTIGSVTINAMKLFDAIMYLPMSFQRIGSTKKFPTNIAGEISLSIVESVYMVLKRDIGSVFFPTNITGVLSLNVGFGVDLHVSPELFHVFILSATFDVDNWLRLSIRMIFYCLFFWFLLKPRNDDGS